jgi:hypothetical protein
MQSGVEAHAVWSGGTCSLEWRHMQSGVEAHAVWSGGNPLELPGTATVWWSPLGLPKPYRGGNGNCGGGSCGGGNCGGNPLGLPGTSSTATATVEATL